MPGTATSRTLASLKCHPHASFSARGGAFEIDASRCSGDAFLESRATLAPMNRRAMLFPLTLALAACATQSPPPAPATAAPPATVAPPAPLLPPVPQPPERPVAPASVTDPMLPQAQRIDAFVDYTASAYGVPAQSVRDGLARAQFLQRTVDIIARPAEAVRPWSAYRPIFLDDARITGGVAFYAQNRADLDRIAASTGVPAEYIVAIIGVETNYRKNTGSYRVLDALYSLAFGYPKRAPFFAGELAQLFALGQDEHIDVASLTGSYAGAMGWGQFMPSSYRNYGKDGDGDGRRDLIGSPRDAFASIANYFIGYGWKVGGTPFVRAVAAPDAQEFKPENFEAKYTLGELAAKGYRPADPNAPDQPATLLTLEGAAGPEYWIGYQNFYVITRYNRSINYAMAVYELAREIKAQATGPAGGSTEEDAATR